MTVGPSVVLIALGAILVWGVNLSVEGVDIGVVGAILMVVGLIGLLVGLTTTADPWWRHRGPREPL